MTPPVKRKERSLSSLVVDIHAATQTRLTKRQTKAFAKRAPTLRGLSPVIDDMTKKEDNNVEKHLKKSNSAERPGKPTFKRKQSFQVYSKAEPSKYTRTEGKLNGEGSFQDKVDIWKPLNCLVEAANRTKSSRSSQQSPAVKAEQTNGPASEVDGNSIKVKERPHKSEVQEQKSENNPMTPEMLKAGSFQGTNQQTRHLTAAAQTPLDAGITQHVRSIGPIWFSLVAAVEQTGEPPLPQISASYLRVKDGSMPVSFVQKYLMRKLNLEKEAEVEIMCLRQPVSPTMSMQNLVEQWLRGGSSQKLPAAVGTSAKELVMVLNYGRCKVPADESQQQHS
ncbi:E3 ubiquitin protein ligase [Musa troglodytarum]|uniref:E3 ubiquitin protein ligase n=1 Tax=Musa troglodytarum TaxID=320322 RepID=A0A9E7KHK7_9LILI|nr:E3 ubiquitin protein ligase [Musa troglodytarum]